MGIYGGHDFRIVNRKYRKEERMSQLVEEQQDFFQRVREAYLRRAAQYPQRLRVIDGSQTLEDVRAQLSRLLEAL
jgi:dTMP kinase